MQDNKIAIITARGGSKRIPRKNIRPFCGRPIIEYSIEAAIQSSLFNEVMVSTDDEEIAEVAIKAGANVPFFRSAENSDDFSGTADVIAEVLEAYKSNGVIFNIGCCLYPTAPFITSSLLKEAFSTFNKHKFEVVFPVIQYSFPIQRSIRFKENSKVEMLWPENYKKRSQDLEPVFHDAGQFYWFNSQFILHEKVLVGDNTGGHIISELMAQDIDTEDDWKLAELKYNRINK